MLRLRLRGWRRSLLANRRLSPLLFYWRRRLAHRGLSLLARRGGLDHRRLNLLAGRRRLARRGLNLLAGRGGLDHRRLNLLAGRRRLAH